MERLETGVWRRVNWSIQPTASPSLARGMASEGAKLGAKPVSVRTQLPIQDGRTLNGELLGILRRLKLRPSGVIPVVESAKQNRDSLLVRAEDEA